MTFINESMYPAECNIDPQKTSQMIDRIEHDAILHAKRTINLSTLVSEIFDDIQIGYTGDNMTSVVFLAEGSVVATLALSYDGSSRLIRVRRV